MNGQLTNDSMSKSVNSQISKSVAPILIELSDDSNSNMEISDDDICQEEEEVVESCCLDFIPLAKDLDDAVEEQDKRRSVTPTANYLTNYDLNDGTDDHPSFDYDSDATWFDDDGKNNEFFQFIPEFLLK